MVGSNISEVGRLADPHEQALDLSLLNGFQFACRPDCGLCCYATPASSPQEIARIREIVEELPLIPAANGFHLIGSRPNGGACAMLQDCRCRVHEARPFPCREFPLSVHLGPRAQATVVLSCPGVSLQTLPQWGTSNPPEDPPSGFEEEIRSVRHTLERSRLHGAIDGRPGGARPAVERHRTALEPDHVERARSVILSDLPALSAHDFPRPPLPEASDGLELLPLAYFEGFGRVALGSCDGGNEVLQIRESGGVRGRLATVPRLDSLPTIDDRGRALLEGYLAYNVRRDAFVWGAAHRNPRSRSIVSVLRTELRGWGAEVVDRAWTAARWLRGSLRTLTVRDIEHGIRWTDADLLDQPTDGRVL